MVDMQFVESGHRIEKSWLNSSEKLPFVLG